MGEGQGPELPVLPQTPSQPAKCNRGRRGLGPGFPELFKGLAEGVWGEVKAVLLSPLPPINCHTYTRAGASFLRSTISPIT